MDGTKKTNPRRWLLAVLVFAVLLAYAAYQAKNGNPNLLAGMIVLIAVVGVVAFVSWHFAKTDDAEQFLNTMLSPRLWLSGFISGQRQAAFSEFRRRLSNEFIEAGPKFETEHFIFTLDEQAIAIEVKRGDEDTEGIHEDYIIPFGDGRTVEALFYVDHYGVWHSNPEHDPYVPPRVINRLYDGVYDDLDVWDRGNAHQPATF